MNLSEFRELWFPCPRLRLPELGPGGPIFIEGPLHFRRPRRVHSSGYTRRAAGTSTTRIPRPASCFPRGHARRRSPSAPARRDDGGGDLAAGSCLQGGARPALLEGPVRVAASGGDAPDVTRIAERTRRPSRRARLEAQDDALHCPRLVHGLLRLEDGPCICSRGRRRRVQIFHPGSPSPDESKRRANDRGCANLPGSPGLPMSHGTEAAKDRGCAPMRAAGPKRPDHREDAPMRATGPKRPNRQTMKNHV
jgi:hypothetical protein